MTTETLLREYQAFRAVGMEARSALRAAKTVVRFRGLEAAELVRLRAEPEQDYYYDVYGEPEAYTDGFGRRVSAERAREEMDRILERDGCWWLVSEYFDGSAWRHADSIGMCVYADPLSPYENWYVVDLMRRAVELREQWVEDMAAAI